MSTVLGDLPCTQPYPWPCPKPDANVCGYGNMGLHVTVLKTDVCEDKDGDLQTNILVKVINVVKHEADDLSVHIGQVLTVGDPAIPFGSSKSCVRVDDLEQGFQYILYATAYRSFGTDSEEVKDVPASRPDGDVAKCDGSPDLVRGWCLGTQKNPTPYEIEATANACHKQGTEPPITFFLLMAVITLCIICLCRKCLSEWGRPRIGFGGRGISWHEPSPANARAVIARQTTSV